MYKSQQSIYSRNYKNWIPVTVHRAGSRTDPNNVHIGNGYMVGTNGYPVPVIRLVRADGTEKWRGVGGYGGQAGPYEEGDRIEARIKDLSQISVYYVRYNQVKQIPFDLGELVNTRTIGLRNNGTEGLGHVDLSNLHYLQNLDLSGIWSVTDVTVSPQAPINFYYLGGASLPQSTIDYLLQMAVNSGIINGTMNYSGRPSYDAWENWETLADRGWNMSLSPFAGTTEVLGLTTAGVSDGTQIQASHKMTFRVKNADGTVRYEGQHSTMHPGGQAWDFVEDGWIETEYYHPTILDLRLSGKGLKTLSLAHLINAKILGFPNNSVATVDLTGLTNLETFNMNTNPLTGITGVAVTNLTYLDLRNTNLTDTDIASVLADLVTVGTLNGTFHYSIKPAASGASAYLTLIERGWTLSIAPPLTANAAADAINFDLLPLDAVVSATTGDTVIPAVINFSVGVLAVTVTTTITQGVTVSAGVIDHSVILETPAIIIDIPDRVLIVPEVLDYRIDANDAVVSFGSAGTVTTQLRPDADIAVGTWSVTPLFSKINDQNTATFITSTNDNGSTATVSIANPAKAATGGVLHVFARRSSGTSADLLIEMLINGIVVSSTTSAAVPTTFTEFTVPFPDTFDENDDFQLRLTRSGGGNPQQRGMIEVSEAYVEVTVPAPSGVTVPVGTIYEELFIEPIDIVLPIPAYAMVDMIDYSTALQGVTVETEDGAFAIATLIDYPLAILSPTVSAKRKISITAGNQLFTINQLQPTVAATVSVDVVVQPAAQTMALTQLGIGVKTSDRVLTAVQAFTLTQLAATVRTPSTSASNLAFSNVQSDSFTLTWTKAGNADASEVVEFRILGSGSGWTTQSTSLNTANISNLTTGEVYEVRVKSNGFDSVLRYSITSTVSLKPAAPTGLFASLVDTNSFRANWTPGVGALTQTYFRRIQGEQTWTYDYTINNNTTTAFSNTGLASGTTYEFMVRATNAGGSADSAIVSVSTTALSPPAAVTGIIQIGETDSSLKFSWTAASGATSYSVYYYDLVLGAWSSAFDTTNTEYNLTGLISGRSYDILIRSRNASGHADASTVRATVLELPKNLAAYDKTPTSVRITWTMGKFGTANTEYLQYKLSSSGTWTELAGSTDGQKALSGLSANTSYDFRVRAMSIFGDTLYSAVYTVTTLSQTSVPVPTNINMRGYDTRIRINWDSLGTGYTYYMEFYDVVNNLLDIKNTTAANYTWVDAIPLSTYNIIFYARNSSNDSSTAVTYQVKTLPQISITQLTYSSGVSIRMNNPPSKLASAIRMYRKPAGSGSYTSVPNTTVYPTGDETTFLFNDTSAVAGTLYDYAIEYEDGYSSAKTALYMLDISRDVAPLSENWETAGGDSGQWANETEVGLAAGENAGDWVLHAGATSSSGTGPAGAQSGTNYLYLEASSVFNKRAWIKSLSFAVTSANRYFNFYSCVYGTDNTGSIEVYVRKNGGTWVLERTINNTTVQSWTLQKVDLGLPADVAQVRLIGKTGPSFACDVAVDNFTFTSS